MREDQDTYAPVGFNDIYLGGNCFDLLPDNIKSNHEIENDNDLEQAAGPSKRRRQNMQNNLANAKTVN